MATAVILPKQGQSVESCILGEWRKKPGDMVKAGDVLFSYETDKSAFEEEAKADGTLLAVFFQEGDDVPVLTTVAVIGRAGEDISAFLAQNTQVEAAKAPEAEEKAATLAPAPTAERVLGVSPRARGTAERMKLDAKNAVPTGPSGRVIERDILALAGKRTGGAAGEAPALQPAPQGGYREEKMPPARRIIAKNMYESLQSMAQLTHMTSFDATDLLELRAHCKAVEAVCGTPKITLNDMILYAVSQTLKTHGYMNAHCLGESMRYFEHVHLGVAVDTPRGLLVPTIFNADQMSLVELSAKARALALAAREGNISPDLLKGGTFTVSNLGAYGVEHFTPVINPPQVGILGVNCIVERVRTADGVLKAYPAMGLSLTYDHRAVDGAPASKFLQALAATLAQFSALFAQ